MFRKSALLFALAMRMSGSAETVDREETRLAALRAIFPGMTIVRTEKRIDKSWRPDLPKPVLSFADGLRDEAVYRVSGPAANEVERCASENMETEKFSETRLVRFRMFRWPVERVHAAVVQYDFEGANPAGSCWSIALVVSLALQGESMRVADRRLLDPMHHSSILSVRVVEVSGDGMDDLLVESDSGGAGTVGSDLHLFNLRSARLDELVKVCSRAYLSGDEEEVYEQVLDIRRTSKTRGREICFDKKVYQENGRWLPSTRVERRCYPVNTGVDESNFSDEPLRPLP